VQIQSAGVEGFVPPQPGVGILVDGIGDGAVQRNGKLYVASARHADRGTRVPSSSANWTTDSILAANSWPG